jgi:hypothetical protein
MGSTGSALSQERRIHIVDFHRSLKCDGCVLYELETVNTKMDGRQRPYSLKIVSLANFYSIIWNCSIFYLQILSSKL